MSTKAFVVNSLSSALGITKKAAAEICETIEKITYESLTSNGKALVPGVGRIKVSSRGARMGQNPKTGQPVPIPARQVFKLAPSKAAKLRINT